MSPAAWHVGVRVLGGVLVVVVGSIYGLFGWPLIALGIAIGTLWAIADLEAL